MIALQNMDQEKIKIFKNVSVFYIEVANLNLKFSKKTIR